MKIYWVTHYFADAPEIPPYRCFFRTTLHEANHDVEYRMKVPDEDDPCKNLYDKNEVWDIEEEEVPDSEFGRCLNMPDSTLALARCPECSVGTIRKMRNGTNDDGTCGTCPYFEKQSN